MRYIKKITAVLIATVMILTVVPLSGNASAANSELSHKIADDTTLRVEDGFETSTDYNGKVWTNKGVSADGDFTALDLSSNVSVNTLQDEFAVVLSALAQGYSTTDKSSIKKANIVFTVDMSTSMLKNYLGGLSRLEILQAVANNFVKNLSTLGDEENYEINLAIAMYAGQGYVKKSWITVNTANLKEIQSSINGINSVSGDSGNTNAQAGAYMARLLYSDEYASTYGRPGNYHDQDTNNFIIFMTDGAPNKYYYNGTSQIGSIALASNKMSTANAGITRNITSTDYKKMAAYKLLEQAEAFKTINNITTFSLGLGEWFVDRGEESGFITATYLMQLLAACADGIRNPVDNMMVTADYCWEKYFGYDVPDGSMPGTNPTFPNLSASKANFLQTNGTYKFTSNSSTHFFSSMTDLINSLNGVEGASVAQSVLQPDVNNRTEDARFKTLDECGIPYVEPELLSQIAYYYAGNTAEKFATSVDDITTAITNSFNSQITSIEDTGDADIDGYIKMVDNIGSGMEFRGVDCLEFDGVKYDGHQLAKFLCTESKENIEQMLSALLKYYTKNFGTTLTISQIEELITGSRNAGILYYNSDDDYGSVLKLYAYYNSVSDTYVYTAPYFNTDGSVRDKPANAQYVVSKYCLSIDIESSLLLNKIASASFFYISVAENISTGDQAVVFKVPAALIPVRTIVVTNGEAHLVGGAVWPVSLFYKVGLRRNNSQVEMNKHLIENDDGSSQYIFYSNAWKSSKELDESFFGTAYSTFIPNKNNPYYNSVNGVQLYVKNGEEYEKASANSTGTMYFLHEWSDSSGTYSKYSSIDDYYSNYSIVLTEDEDGVTSKHLSNGAMRKDSRIEYDKLKSATSAGNATGTNEYYYQPDITINQNNVMNVNTVLGNNGKLIISPQNIAINDSVVVDYGLDVPIDVLANDTFPEGAQNISVTNVALVDSHLNNIQIYVESAIDNKEKSVKLENGTLSVNSDGTALIYDVKSSDFCNPNKAFYECSYKLNGIIYYCYGYVTVMPANNIYYEQDFCTLSSDWTSQGTALSTRQDGTDSYVHGYDTAYDASDYYSNGTAVKTTVTNDQYQTGLSTGTVKWPTATFTFYGTAFDVISYTGLSTGLMTVTVTNIDTGATVKNIAVNTHYSSRVGDTSNGNYSDLYQIPVITYDIGAYGHYQLTIKASYHPYFDLTTAVSESMSLSQTTKSVAATSASSTATNDYTYYNNELACALKEVFADSDAEVEYYTVENGKIDNHVAVDISEASEDIISSTACVATRAVGAKASSGQYDVYIDAVRVYNPAGVKLTSGDIFNAYTALNEINPTFMKLRDILIKTESDSPEFIVEHGANGAMYVEQNVKNTYDNEGNIIETITSGGSSTIAVSTYAKNGPNSEIYLEYGNAIAFRINDFNPNCYVQVSAKTPTHQDAVLAVNGNVVDTVRSGTEMYYDISPYVSSNGIIVISNLGQGILSLCNIKSVSKENTLSVSSLISDSLTMQTVNSVLTANTSKAPAMDDEMEFNVKLTAQKNGKEIILNRSFDISSKKFKYSLDENNEWVVTLETADYIDYLEEIIERYYNGAEITYEGPESMHFEAEYDKTSGKWITDGVEATFSVKTSSKDDNGQIVNFIQRIVNFIVKVFKRIFPFFN